jgi:chromosome segregation ATPase
MSDPAEQAPESPPAVSAAELRNHRLPGQRLGGYSRQATDELLARAARALEASSTTGHAQIAQVEQPNEHAVGEALITAHRVADGVRAQAKEEADTLLAAARSEAEELVREAERRAGELRAESARIEEALGRAREEANLAETAIAALRGEAERVRSVIDDFRTQWWNLITDAHSQLELRLPGSELPDDGGDGFARDLRDRLVAARASDEPARLNQAQAEAARPAPGVGGDGFTSVDRG